MKASMSSNKHNELSICSKITQPIERQSNMRRREEQLTKSFERFFSTILITFTLQQVNIDPLFTYSIMLNCSSCSPPRPS